MSKLLRGGTAQLLLFTVLPLTIVLAVSSVGSISIHQQAMRRMVSERDFRTVVATASAIGAMLQHKTDVLESVAESAARDASRSWTLTDTLALDADIAREFPGGVALYAKGGVLLRNNAAAAQWAQLGMPIPGMIAITESFGARIEVWNDMLVLHAQDRSLSVTAIGVLPVSALGLSALVNPAADAVTIDAFLFGEDGRAIANTQSGQFNAYERDHPGMAEALSGLSGGLYWPDPRSGDEHVVSYAPIVTNRGQTGLGIIIEEPWQTVLYPLMRYSLAMPLITLPVLLLAVLAVMFGLRRIVQPLQRLDQQARNIGTGDFSALSQPVFGIVEIEQLQETLRAMASQIRADQERLRDYAHKVTETQESERKRLARELHDDTIQNLIVLSQRIQAMRQTVAREQPRDAAQLNELRGMVVQVIEGVRRFSRALRPIYLEEAGLVAALDRLAAESNEMAQSNAQACAVVFGVREHIPRLKPDAELALYRIAQEALANALRHASPTRIDISLIGLPESGVQLQVEDNGNGFIERAKLTDGPDKPSGRGTGGFGIMGIRERALLIGARVNIHSESGKGTRVVVTYQPAPAR